MEKEVLDALVEKAKGQIKEEMEKTRKEISGVVSEIVEQKGFATQEQYEALDKAQKESAEKVQGILKKQGITLSDIQERVGQSGGRIKSIPEVLKEHEAEFKQIYSRGMGTKEFCLTFTPKGEPIFRPFDRMKADATGPTGTVDGLVTDGVSSVVNGIVGDSSILRLGGTGTIVNNYVNTTWLFDLITTSTVDFSNRLAIYWEELEKLGSAAIVDEGDTKPLVQYRYKLRTEEFQKYAQLITFTDEFYMDFRQLYDDILGKGRRDIANGVNAAVLTDIIANATAYNTSASFGTVPFANDFDAIAAMAAQVDAATFGNNANAALMSTYKKYNMGVSKNQNGSYLNPPDVLSNIRFIGNPAMAADAVVVGDLKQYNLMFRGGLIVKVGYNGTDFAENKFSVVMEQFYCNYISDARKSAIVKGPDFATVKTAIDEPATT